MTEPSNEANGAQESESPAPVKPSQDASHAQREASSLRQRARLYRNLTVVFAALSIVLLVVAMLQWNELQNAGAVVSATTSEDTVNSGEQIEPEQADSADSSCRDLVRRDAEDPMAIGDVNAPVVLMEWTDFRCPYCGAFSRDTMPNLIEEYVDSGKVRIEFHDVNFIDGDTSTQVAVAARAAGMQGKYREYLEVVYADMEGERPEMTSDLLVEYAERAGVADLAGFTSNLSSEALGAEVQESADLARSIGVTSVPTFVDSSNCQALQGAQDISTFRTFLDSALGGAPAQ